MPLLTRPSLLAIVLSGMVATLGAQEGEAEAKRSIAEIKAEFVGEMYLAISPSGAQYVSELLKLERKYAADGKFEAAIETRDERLALEKFLADGVKAVAEKADSNNDSVDEAASATRASIDFTDTAASISDGGAFDGDGLSLSLNGATASWQLGEFEPGGYEIIVIYTAAEDAKVQVQESFFRLSGELPATAGKRSSLVVGTLKITEQSTAFSIVHDGSKGDGEGSKLIIHSVSLISAKQD
ncbi:MAG: hypothetical protein ACI8XO_000805 [Verrucomicrobiales bacterium]|jgi:hypothetical protein